MIRARQDVHAAAIAAGVGLAIIVLIAAIGLIQRATMVTSGPPQDGDPISIPTAAPLMNAEGNALCHGALLAGRLVAHPAWGLAVQAGADAPLRIVWPHGYVGRRAGDRIELLDHSGGVIARSGDSIEMGGPAANVKPVEGFGACPNSVSVSAAQP